MQASERLMLMTVTPDISRHTSNDVSLDQFQHIISPGLVYCLLGDQPIDVPSTKVVKLCRHVKAPQVISIAGLTCDVGAILQVD